MKDITLLFDKIVSSHYVTQNNISKICLETVLTIKEWLKNGPVLTIKE